VPPPFGAVTGCRPAVRRDAAVGGVGEAPGSVAFAAILGSQCGARADGLGPGLACAFEAPPFRAVRSLSFGLRGEGALVDGDVLAMRCQPA
jgi:hypothetical protein